MIANGAMRTLTLLDYTIIASYILLCFAVGLYFTRRAGQSTEHYFVGGRSMPWWLLGISMAATNFSSDTPLAIAKLVYQDGIAGVWFMWAGSIQVMLAVFLFSQLWRRSEVITDVQIVEHRYGGKPAAVLRFFKGFYFGVLFNCIIMGFVYKGLIKIMTGVTPLDTTQVLVFFTAIVVVYVFASGIYGVLWTDFAQYIVAMVGFGILAWLSVKEAGGFSTMLTKLETLYGQSSGITQFYPTWPQADQWMPLSVFITYIGMQWWAHKFADGGGKHIQRMLSAKNETHAVLGTFLFSFMSFVIQVWPWIITALAGLVIFGRELPDPEMAFPMMMARVLPNGLLGLLLIAAIAAFMSTISTHTNLGSAYLINDIYRRFMVKNASDKHYVFASRIATLVILAVSIVVAMNINSIADTWKLLVQMTAGAGLTWILRWFWWRINAWTEMAAMTTSGLTTLYLSLQHPTMLYSHKMWIIVGVSTVIWLAVTFLTKPVDEKTLKSFVEKVRPAALGWKPIYHKYPIRPNFKLGRALLNWGMGLVFLFSLNFGLGNLLLLEITKATGLLTLAAFMFVLLLFRIRQQTKTRPSLEEPVIAVEPETA